MRFLLLGYWYLTRSPLVDRERPRSTAARKRRGLGLFTAPPGLAGCGESCQSWTAEECIMAAVNSTMLPLGTPAPDFHLPDPAGRLVSRDDFGDAPALLVMFICNHCPYVKRIRDGLASFARDYQARHLGMVAINSN